MIAASGFELDGTYVHIMSVYHEIFKIHISVVVFE